MPNWPNAAGNSPIRAGSVEAETLEMALLEVARAMARAVAQDGEGATKLITVKVSDATTYRDPAVTSPTIANVTVGEHVAVFGTDASNVVTATSVAIGGPGVGGPGGFPAGGLGGPPRAMPGSSSG